MDGISRIGAEISNDPGDNQEYGKYIEIVSHCCEYKLNYIIIAQVHV
jgi:hypothetical protein